MRIERLFNPIKIILETPEEVSSLEWLLKKYREDTEKSLLGWMRPERKMSEREAAEYRFFTSLLKTCEQTSKHKEFKS